MVYIRTEARSDVGERKSAAAIIRFSAEKDCRFFSGNGIDARKYQI